MTPRGPPDGLGEPDLGRSADRARTLAQARPAGLSSHGRQVSAFAFRRGPGRRISDQRWTTFVRNHAEAIVDCGFFTVVTAAFKVLYVSIAVEHATRGILRFNVTQHPTADWTRQQLREVIPGHHPYRFSIRDRDAEFSPRFDESIRRMGLHVLATPTRVPQANGICERTIGTKGVRQMRGDLRRRR